MGYLLFLLSSARSSWENRNGIELMVRGLVIQWQDPLLCPGDKVEEAWRVSWLGPRGPIAGSEFSGECLVCPVPTTARNRLFGGGHLQVIGQRLPLGEADDAGDLAACSPAHRTL